MLETITVQSIDDCIPIESEKEWKINLTKDPLNRNQEILPDWYGYWLIS